jgi:hypothetical protein
MISATDRFRTVVVAPMQRVPEKLVAVYFVPSQDRPDISSPT